MSLRDKLKDYKTRFKEGTRRVFGGKSGSVQSTGSVPDLQRGSLSVTPAPSSLRVPADPFTRPTSAPPSSAQLTGLNEALTSTSVSPATSPLPQTAAVAAPSSSTLAPPNDQTPEADTTQFVEPTGSIPDPQISSSIPLPAPSAPAVPAGTDPILEPVSTQSTSAQSTEPNEPRSSINIPTLTSPVPQVDAPEPSSSAPPTSPRPAQLPDTNTSRFGQKAFQTFLTSLQVGPLKEVAEILAGPFEAYKDNQTVDSDYKALQEELEGLCKTLDGSFSGDDSGIIEKYIDDLRGSIKEEMAQISVREQDGAGWQLLHAEEALNKVKECRRRIRVLLDKSTLGMVGELDKTVAQQGTALGGLEKRVDGQEKTLKDDATENRLKALKPSLEACYNSLKAATLMRRECTPNTRTEVLSDLAKWRHDSNQGNIFWMNGMAGTGKTTIANTLCTTLESERKLGASFFCSRQLPECRDVNLILPTIAYQLARFSPNFRDALSPVLERDPDIPTKSLQIQLRDLIIGPLGNISESLPTDVVIVIDALDECEDSSGVGRILELFVNHVSELPIRVFLSSRPEEQIRRNVGSMKAQLVLHELDNKIVKGDIEIYLRAELEGVSISESQLSQLVDRAGVLFIYAATAIRYIKAKKIHSAQQARVKTVLNASSTPSSNKNKDIDVLYSAVLTSTFDNPNLDEEDINRMRLVLHTVVCAQEPLTAGALAKLLQLDHGDLVLDALEPLWSVLHVSGSGGSSLVTTLHASFPDYLFDTQRSHEHCCNATSHQGRLAELCFERIEGNEQQFNICGLQSSYVFDDEVPGLEERVKQAIPLDLSYACQYWAVHLELGGASPSLIQLLENFLSKRLLLWIEVLNLKRRMNIGPVLLEKARKWCTNQGGPETTQGLIHDAWRFTTTFAANPVSRSTPHLYVSMLAFWPNSKLISDLYVKRAGGLAEVGGSGMLRRQLALLGVFPVGSEVYSVAFSPDGARIICACGDRTIRVWDAQSGKAVLGLLQGHAGPVYSVACSPDGHRIASGSEDNTIRVWDARSGKMALEPLEGHTDRLWSVAFSPDSARIVSGSNDKTIRVWDAQTGELVLGPLEGHTSFVLSVAFSPDGMRIVSGSADNKIRVWDSQGGQLVLGPLQGHTNSVHSVAFSPDSARIVSGSSDKTIRVWNAQTGEIILEPLEGHTDSVHAVAYSPDGMHIVSGSEDKAIRMWDARSGQVVLGPLEGNTEGVSSIAFSPDGMRIVSGSEDQTVRVWDAQSREVSPGPCDGHTESVHSVAFAPDGRRIASGSGDCTIRVWDAQSGEMILGPLEGHAGWVTSVAFSPDGMHIASGSWDMTIRVWDSQNGNLALQPLKGHENWVHSVVFSPDNTRIVSGARDNQIRVWDVCSGSMVLGPLEGHTGPVYSVAVSLDGRWIVSGSADRTIRVWDAHNGRELLGPLKGHAGEVNSVALPPDGNSIVSGSRDETIRVWNAQTGQMALAPLEGHTDWVRSVAFSPNGTYIVSGSHDKTIRVWSAQTGELVLGPLQGHMEGVVSTSFSPDSTRIVSGSWDKAIRVWHSLSPPSTDNSTPGPPAAASAFHSKAHSQIHQPSPLHLASGRMSLPWTMNNDGWVVDAQQQLWLWVPPDLRASLMLPNHPLLISPQGVVQLNFDDANMGKSWAKCYTPA